MRKLITSGLPVALAVALGLGVTWCSSAVTPPEPEADGGSNNWGSDAGPAADAGTDAGTRPDPKGFLGECATDADCLSGYCLPSKLCSKACANQEGCPGGGWTCTAIHGDDRVCQCAPTSQTEACDGVDNDCDGQVDEQATCEGAAECKAGVCSCPEANKCGTDCTDLQSDPAHCGTCSNVCRANEICSTGACSCPGKVCNGSCTITDFDSFNCGACGNQCSPFEECVSGTCSAVNHDWASWQPRPAPQLSSASGGVLDTVTGLTWTSDSSLTPKSWDEASAFCDSLDASGAEQAGASLKLWRVPSRIELVSIIDYTREGPALSPSSFPNAIAGAYWTSTPAASDANNAWAVNFIDGSVDIFPKAAQFAFVRCVR